MGLSSRAARHADAMGRQRAYSLRTPAVNGRPPVLRRAKSREGDRASDPDMLQRFARWRADFPVSACGAGLLAIPAHLALVPCPISTYLHGKHRPEMPA